MPSFSTEVPHSMGKEAAKERLDSFLEKIGEKYKSQIGEMEGGWAGDVLSYSFVTFGIKVSGTMTVGEDKVVLTGEIPFSAMMFKGKIANGMKEAVEKALAK